MPKITSILYGTWIPAREVTALDGKSLPADADFFVKPPPEIGIIVSARSDVRKGQTLWPLPAKLAVDLVLVALAAVAVNWAKTHSPEGTKPGLGMVMLIIGPIEIAIVAIAFSFRQRWIGYVGKRVRQRSRRAAIAMPHQANGSDSPTSPMFRSRRKAKVSGDYLADALRRS